MEKYKVISRRGVLNLKGNKTDNQCAKPGHEVYNYEIRVLFAQGTKLDGNGFIIDHQVFDDAVQKVSVNSCEIMANAILEAIETVLLFHKLECIGIKLQIKPKYVVEENSAYFEEYRCSKHEYFAVVMSL